MGLNLRKDNPIWRLRQHNVVGAITQFFLLFIFIFRTKPIKIHPFQSGRARITFAL